MSEKTNSRPNSVLLVGGSTLLLLLSGLMYAWSVFKIYLLEVFPGWTASQCSMCFTIAMCCYCFGGFFGGKCSGRYGNAWTVRIAGTLLLIAYTLCWSLQYFAAAAALSVLYLGFGVFGGVGTGMIYNGAVSGATRWFPTRTGTVSGVMLLGFGLGSMVMGAFVQAIEPVIGIWNVFLLLGVMLFAALWVGSLLYTRAPEKATAKAAGAEKDTDLTTGQMLRTPSFWLYFFWNMTLAASGLLVINSAANIAAYYGAAAIIGMIVSVSNGGLRPVMGVMADKLGLTRSMLVLNVGLLAAGALLLVTGLTGSRVTMVAGLVLIGVVFGGGVTVSSAVIHDLYGHTHYAVNFSLSNFCSIPASFLGPLVAGALQDRADGDYTTTFAMLIALGTVSLVLNFVLKAQLRRENRLTNQ